MPSDEISTPRSSGESAYAALLDALRNGIYAPGDRLREEKVATRLGLSRTPVREALRRLESDGIIDHRPRVGAVIRTLSHAELVELYEMRVVLERTAAQMAAQHAAWAEIDALEELNRRIAESGEEPARGAAINQSFHKSLYLAGRNRFLMEAARALNNSLMLLGPTTYTDLGRIEEVAAQHSRIIEALRARNAQAAGDAAEAHLQASLRYRLKDVDA